MQEEKEQQISELGIKLQSIVDDPSYHPVKPKAIAKKLGLDADGRRILRRAIKRLVKQGSIRYGANHVVYPNKGEGKPSGKGDGKPAKTKNEVVGVFQRTASGFGFVRPAGEGGGLRRNDIFIPRDKTEDAATGDRVRIKVTKGKPGDERRRGRILEVLERRVSQFVGVYSERKDQGYVQVDGKSMPAPIYVGDAGAKNVRAGDKVVIEMVRYPTHDENGEAVITEVLGPRGEPGVDTMSIIREFELPGDFPEASLADAKAQAEEFDEDRIEAPRRDLRDTTVITIDPVDARDFDDAISLEMQEGGFWRLGVHIADVSHFVRLNSPLDREARDRATSVYLPDRVIPMIPEIISNNLASLQPHRTRYAKTVFIEFTPDGIRTDIEWCSSAIKSDHRFNYEEVDSFLSDREAWREKLEPKVFSLLERMHALAMMLRKRRRDTGALELTLPEIKIDFDNEGKVNGAHFTDHTESHQIIEEFMLAANQAVADRMNELGLHFMRRIHEAPESRKLKLLTQFVRDVGIPCESLESRFEVQRVIDETTNRPEAYAIHFAILRSMQKAIYSPIDEGHFALNMDNYCHFTSPIRRYPDLVIHRMIDAMENETSPQSDLEQLLLLGEHCSDREQRAEKAERELVKVKLLNFLKTKMGEKMDAVITGVEEYGLFAQGTKLPADGFISIEALEFDNFQFDAATHTLTGNKAGNVFRLGDRIQVEIDRVDVDRRELDFRLAGRPKSSRTATSPRGGGPRKGKGKPHGKRKPDGKRPGGKGKRPRRR